MNKKPDSEISSISIEESKSRTGALHRLTTSLASQGLQTSPPNSTYNSVLDSSEESKSHRQVSQAARGGLISKVKGVAKINSIAIRKASNVSLKPNIQIFEGCTRIEANLYSSQAGEWIYFYILYGSDPETSSRVTIQASKQLYNSVSIEDLEDIKLEYFIDSKHRQAILWRYAIQASEIRNLKLSFNLLDKQDSSIYSIIEDITSPEYTHNYLLYFTSSKQFPVYRPRSSETLIKSPLDQLTYLIYFIFSHPNSYSFVSDLVSQFLEYYLQTYKIYEKDLVAHRSLLFKTLDLLLREKLDDMQDKIVSALIIIGLVQSTSSSIIQVNIESSRCILNYLKIEFNRMIDEERQEPLKKYLMKGVINQMFMNKLLKDSIWLDVFENMQDANNIETIIVELMSILESKQYRAYLDPDEAIRIIKKLQSYPLQQASNLFNSLFHYINELQDFIEFLFWAFQLTQETSTKPLQCAIDQFIRKYPLMSLIDLSLILKFIYYKPLSFKQLFYTSIIQDSARSLIYSNLNSSESIEYLKHIYRDYYDSVILDRVYVKEVAIHLIHSNNEISAVMNSLRLTAREGDEVLKEWLKSIFTSKSIVPQLIELFDNSVISIEDPLVISHACSIFLTKLNELCKYRRLDILRYSYIFDSCKVLSLKSDYINYITSKFILPASTKPESSRHKLIQRMYKLEIKHPLSSTCAILNRTTLGTLTTEVSEQDIKHSLYISPSESSYLYFILSNYDMYSNVESMKSITEIVLELGNKIIEKTISIKDMILIRKHNENSRKVFLYYMQKVLIFRKELADGFEEYLKEATIMLNKRLEDIELCRSFVEIIIQDSKELSILKQEVEAVLENYEERGLIEGDISLYLREVYDTATVILPIIHSKIFNYILTHHNYRQILNSSNVYEVYRDAYHDLKQFLILLEKESNIITIDQLKAFHLEEDNIEQELSILCSSRYLSDFISEKAKIFIYYYSFQDSIHHYTSLILQYNNLTHKIEPDLIQTIHEYHLYFKSYLQTLPDFLFISTKLLSSLSISYPDFKDLRLSSLLSSYLNFKELIEYLSNLSLEEIEYIREGVNDYDESFVEIATILDLEYLWHFQQGIMQAIGYHSLVSYISTAISQSDKSIEYMLESCYLKLGAIKDLFINLYNQESAKLSKILDICKESEFLFVRLDRGYDVKLHCGKYSNRVYSLSDLAELKDRAALVVYTAYSSMQDNSEIYLISRFIELVNCISTVIDIMNELYLNGYSEIESEQFKFTCKQGEFDTLIEYEKDRKKLTVDWERSLYEAYKKFYWLTYLTGRQIWILESYLVDNKNRSNQAEHLLRFIGKVLPDKMNRLRVDTHSIEERLFNLGEYVRKLPDSKRIEYSVHYKIRNEAHISYKKGEVLLLETNNYLNGVMSLYMNAGQQFPRGDQVFFCNKDTQFYEISTFLYRCFLNTEDELYVIANSEMLPLEIQQRILTLFHKLYQDHPNSFHIGFVTFGSRSLLTDHFTFSLEYNVIHIRNHQLISDSDLAAIIRAVSPNTQCICSSSSGLGKTHYIQSQSELSSKPLISFPISGNIALKDIYYRFLHISLPEDSILHLTLNYVEDSYVINSILIHLSLFRLLNTHYGVISLPESCFLYIEISNSLSDSWYNSGYLQYLNSYHIPAMSLDNLVVSNKDGIQLVSNYMMLYDRNMLDNTVIDDDALIHTQLSNTEDIITLYNKYFLERESARNLSVNFIQLRIFGKILEYLLKNFSKCYFFSSDNLKYLIKDIKISGLNFLLDELLHLRATVFESLLYSTEEFTARSIHNIKRMQEYALSSILDTPNDEVLSTDLYTTFSWESSNHFILIFLQDGSLMPIYRSKEFIPESIKKLIHLQSNIYINLQSLASRLQSKSYDIEDYSTMTHIDLLKKLQTFCVKEDLVTSYGESDYVMTPDNFLKMCLIYVRVMAGIPVVIMGETGCGKTSLVKFFVNNVLHDTLQVINIHAGVSLKNIKEIMQEVVEKARRMEEGKKMWVFFDEFNTSDCIGVIHEIMCEHSLEGEPLPGNIAFLAACNPYRLKMKKLYDEDVGLKKTRSSKLMHIVKPLPDSMLEYVWDFGHLQEKDLRRYIYSMLKRLNTQYLDLFVNLLITAHKYFQLSEDPSSVSLRDIRRFIILYNWFKLSISTKDSLINTPRFISQASKYKFNRSQLLSDIDLRSGILSLSHCYYLRISSFDRRTEFLTILCQAMPSQDLNATIILDILKYEQYDYILRMDLPEGTAINSALRENIFAVIPCIMNKIPIIICGKPGCSKTLAISLVFSNLRGERSTDSYFKTLPGLSMFAFQGSNSCKSSGIEKVFKRARKYLESVKKNVLPVVVFDEIGLAEISKHNPLKVLHSLLEIENGVVSFVGISNWRLDASKMNRVLYLARPDPDENELKHTAMSIYKSYTKEAHKYKDIIHSLASSYSEFKNCFKDTPNSDFYGLRDFYSMIKQVSTKLINFDALNRSELAGMIQRSIDRNFGGLPGAADMLTSIFFHKYNLQDIDPIQYKSHTLDLISDNLQDKDARYLMFITPDEFELSILENLLSSYSKNRRVLIGSSLENDVESEEYAFQSLSEVILYAEKGVSVVFGDMESIYSSLYDLFNQKFVKLGNRRYCRIALGALYNPRCFVDNNFRAIVLMNEDAISTDTTDAAFLNRFEKHTINMLDILNESERSIVYNLNSWISNILTIADSKLVLNARNIFPIYSEGIFECIVLNQRYNEKEDIASKCKNIMMKCSFRDLLILVSINGMDREEAEKIKRSWRYNHDVKFVDYITSLVEESNKIVIRDMRKVFVYSYDRGIIYNLFSSELEEVIDHKIFTLFKSEQDIRKDLLSFFSHKSQMIYMLEIDYEREAQHLSLVKYLIDKLEDETKHTWECQKSIVILVRMKRNGRNLQVQNWFGGWSYFVFDEINSEKMEIDDEILSKTTEDLISEEKLRTLDHLIENLTEKCMLKLRYEPISAHTKESLNDHIFYIIQNILHDSKLKYLFKSKLLKMLQDKALKLKDWRKQIFCDLDIIMNSSNLYSAILLTLEQQVESLYTSILYQLENMSVLKSYFTYYDLPCGEVIRKIWSYNFESLTSYNIRLQNLNSSIRTNISMDIIFPFIKKEYSMISTIYKQYLQDMENQHFIATPDKAFEFSYKNSSILSNSFGELGETSELEELYIRNLIKIYLIENLLSIGNEEFIYIFLYSSYIHTQDVSQKVLQFYKYDNIFKISIALMESFGLLLNEDFRLAFIKKLDSSDIIYKENISPALRLLVRFYENLIEDIAPSEEILYRLEGANNYLALLEKIYNLLSALSSSENIGIKNIDHLHFWLSYTTLLVKVEQEYLLIQAASHKYVSFKLSSFMYEHEFSEYIIDHLSSIPDYDTNCHILKFLSSYLSLLITKDPENFVTMADFMDRTEIWKYSTEIIGSIIQVSKLGWYMNRLHRVDDISEIRIPENEYIIRINEVLDKYGLDSKFGILISDKLIKCLRCDEDCSSYQESVGYILLKLKPVFNYYSNLLDKDSIMKLISMIIDRKVCDIYSYILSHDITIDEPQQQFMDEISSYLYQGPHSAVLQLYCIKRIKQLKDLTIDSTYSFLTNKSQIDWISEYILPSGGIDYTILPIIPSLADKYYSVAASAKKLFSKPPKSAALDDIIINSSSPNDRLVLGLVLQNIIFRKFLLKDTINLSLKNWYELKKELLIRYLGKDFNALIYYFIFNFPKTSILWLSPDTSNHYYLIMTVCLALNILLSHSTLTSPITSIFFDANGNIQPNFSARFISKFIFAAESDPILDDLKFKLTHYETLKSTTWIKSYSKGGSYKCSDTCDYLYFIDNCGGASVTSICPYCRATIGGSDHIAYNRPGHLNLSDEEAIAFLRNRISIRERESERGYKIVNEDTPYVRNLKPISYKLLRFILNTGLYFVKLSGIANDEDMNKILGEPSENYERKLERIIGKDLEFVWKGIDVDEGYVWIYSILERLPRFLCEFQVEPNSCKVRNDFEISFETQVVNPSLISPLAIIKDYKSIFINSESQIKFDISAIEELSLPLSSSYTFLPLFRITRDPSISNVINLFNLSLFRSLYPLLDLYINNLTSFNSLKSLYPIIEFTNYLLKEYSHTISRQEARETPIVSIIRNNSELSKLYTSFLLAWNNAEFTELQYGCKQLGHIRFDENSPLIYFLVDDKEEGGGMYMAAALQYFAGLQNSLISRISQSVIASRGLDTRYIFDNTEYSIQRIQKCHILSSTLTNNNIQDYAVNNILYGYGKEIIYNLDQIETTLLRDFSNAKILNQNQLNLIQYSFELMNSSSNSGILSEIRSQIPQIALDRESAAKLELFIETISKEQVDNALKEIYSSLNIIISYLRYAVDVENDTIFNFTQRIKSNRVSKYFREENLISRLNVKNIIEVYEFIEEKYFNIIKRFVNPEFNSRDRQDEITRLIENLAKLTRNNDKLPRARDIEKAFMRFIARYLTGNLDPSIEISIYLGDRDLWSEGVSVEMLDELEAAFPKNVHLSHAILVYEVLKNLHSDSSTQTPKKKKKKYWTRKHMEEEKKKKKRIR